MKSMDVTLELSTARHQQTNGLAENGVKRTKTALRAFVDYKGKNWAKALPAIEFALNNNISSSTGFSAFQLAFGLNPGSPIEQDVNIGLSIMESIKWAKLHIAKQQDKMEQLANENRSIPPDIFVGSRVLLDRTGISWPAHYHEQAKLLPKRL